MELNAVNNNCSVLLLHRANLSMCVLAYSYQYSTQQYVLKREKIARCTKLIYYTEGLIKGPAIQHTLYTGSMNRNLLDIRLNYVVVCTYVVLSISHRRSSRIDSVHLNSLFNRNTRQPPLYSIDIYIYIDYLPC